MSESSECIHEWVTSNASVFDGVRWVDSTTLTCRWCRETLPCDRHGWVRVEDAMPSDGVQVEAFSSEVTDWPIEILEFRDTLWEDSDGDSTQYIELYPITHWRPLRPDPEKYTDTGRGDLP